MFTTLLYSLCVMVIPVPFISNCHLVPNDQTFKTDPPSTKSKVGIVKRVISTVESVAATAMVLRRVSRDYLPVEFRREFEKYIARNVLNKFSNQFTMVFDEFDGYSDNEIYNAAQLYLSTRISSEVRRVNVTKNPNQEQFNVAMETNEYTDVYNGVHFTRSLLSKQLQSDDRYGRTDIRSLELTFHQKHKDFVLNSYMPYIINTSETHKQNKRTVKLFTLEGWYWKSVKLDHPATFETVAMDPGMQEMLVKDLDRFVARREHYRKVGKAWIRGYLLNGPPGTGKSSLVAAIANYLKFDIYDLDLTDICSNSELRRVLLGTANRSILVVEDIDCSVKLHNRGAQTYNNNGKLTLSGFLNSIDGISSSCGDERIIIFTTNRKEVLDPALVRPGRMDVHIHMSYCTPYALRVLVSIYLSITEHDLLEDIDELVGHVDVTPAEVAEQLLVDEDPDIVLGGLVEFLDAKRKKNDQEAKARLKEKEELAAKESEKKQQQKKLKKAVAKKK
ncbi:putative AAA+ ATPase domain, ATPase, AAA-type, core, AAA-type ATPase domain-containing protein [Helianthus annuus]|nr:putative AAA+ ATPase domain, ATPase, AAA-type, core, AAA-type ATPase domain-containing protein [Helianthus annuus]